MSDDNDTKDRSVEQWQCERRIVQIPFFKDRVTVIDVYEICDEKNGEINLWCTDNVLRPARRVKRVISPRNRGIVEREP
jgi:hypothetical protein